MHTLHTPQILKSHMYAYQLSFKKKMKVDLGVRIFESPDKCMNIYWEAAQKLNSPEESHSVAVMMAGDRCLENYELMKSGAS